MKSFKKSSFFLKILRYGFTIFIIISINFILPRMMPGDPLVFLFGEEVYGAAIRNPQLLQSLSEKYGLDKSLSEQFLIYIGNIINGDFGQSFSFGRSVAEIIAERIPLTLMLTIPSTILSLFIGTLLGLSLGFNSNSHLKRSVSSFLIALHSIPSYWFAMLLLLVFSLWLNLTPTGGAPPKDANIISILHHIALPFSLLTILNIAYISIIIRGLTMEIAEEPFVMTARSKGLSWIKLRIRHLLLPSLAPFLSLAAMELGFAFSGALLVEIAFSWPGIGYTMWQAVVERDYPLLQGAFTAVSLIVVLANAIADVLSYIFDPRIRMGENE
ncbi:MAG: ABC transporter permease [Candidatus Methanomethyliaceae archaeon]|nr:ABC transporter permease [Candidatus Methanomethyliaceae archaeon]MCX8169601.1 ABC transporter permease [Candidatus Methanomethyliaceae archaeon]MDW7970414.1 ABC transporter permease [Nitrososphaerota archaeon]